jgi:hypothetical protein
MSNNTSTFERPFGDPLHGFDFRLFEFDCRDLGDIEETKKRYPPGYVERWQREFIDRIKSKQPHP